VSGIRLKQEGEVYMEISNEAKMALEKWHEAVFDKSEEALDELLSDEIVLHSPFVFRPKDTKKKAKFILENVVQVLEDFKYNRQIMNDRQWALEFEAKVGDIVVKGMDLIEFDENWQIKYFEVFMRPFKGLMAVAEAMDKRIKDGGGEPTD